tara:strand:- start:678 stop:965 length:288 start_codon:yes stop_codon:yes gene_type:complete
VIKLPITGIEYSGSLQLVVCFQVQPLRAAQGSYRWWSVGLATAKRAFPEGDVKKTTETATVNKPPSQDLCDNHNNSSMSTRLQQNTAHTSPTWKQ